MSASTKNPKLGRRKRETFADKTFNRILMEVVGPILIILMIGALVFFLIDIFYRGPHSARLRWVLGLFTIAAVLVSRISIDSGIERAALFGSALGVATFIVTLTLVDFEYGSFVMLEPVVVIAFIAIVMWCANRLTWDCTMIDESRDVSSIGLTELVRRKIAGKETKKKPRSKPSEDSTKEDSTKDSKKGSSWFALFANSSTRNTPGLWVFYFAIAAFPIFGFGQWFAQPSDGWGYRWIFFLFALYLASGLGLLMLTSLLGLERYVNKRGAELPGIVSRTWMVVGTLFALAVMLVMLILPSPSISNGLENALAFLTTNSKEPNKHAVGKDGQKEGENPNNQKVDNQAKDAPKRDGDKGEAKGKGKDGKQSSNNKSKGNKSDSKSGGKGKSQGKDQKSKSGDKSSSKSKSESKGDKSDKSKSDNKAQDQKSKPEKSKDLGKKPDNKGRENPDDKAKEKPQDQAKNPPQKQQQKQAQKNANNKKANNNGRAKPAPNPASKVATSISKSLGSIIKFVVYAIGIIALLIALWLFRDELAKLWNDLFGAKPESEDEEQTVKKKRAERPKPSFESFKEPFSSGQASNWTPAQTIQYTFQALEAWGRGYEHPRDEDQTPHEFAKQLTAVNKEVAAEARHLADLHGQSLFSGDDVDQNDASQLKRIWKLMTSNSPVRRSAMTSHQPSV